MIKPLLCYLTTGYLFYKATLKSVCKQNPASTISNRGNPDRKKLKVNRNQPQRRNYITNLYPLPCTFNISTEGSGLKCLRNLVM